MKPDKDLSPELRRVAREGGTEAPFTGKYHDSHEKGMYKCVVCGSQLFSSDVKFETKVPGLMGWPSFEDALPGAVEFKHDPSYGMSRTEVLCAKCGSHLGHFFEIKNDTETKTGKHYCINSVCLDLEKKPE
jgi:peptide-methionine (R)-S-oxide reductase